VFVDRQHDPPVGQDGLRADRRRAQQQRQQRHDDCGKDEACSAHAILLWRLATSKTSGARASPVCKRLTVSDRPRIPAEVTRNRGRLQFRARRVLMGRSTKMERLREIVAVALAFALGSASQAAAQIKAELPGAITPAWSAGIQAISRD